MSTRLDQCFAKLKQEGRPALVTYMMAGDPDLPKCQSLLEALPASGADIIELGMPFSDPMADGPTIQAAAIRALANKVKMTDVLQMVAQFRQSDSQTPIVLMGYYNPLLHYGLEKFVAECAKVGVDGLIIVDVPLEEDADLSTVCQEQGISLIRLVAPTTQGARLEEIVKRAAGFIYYVSVAGVTGTKEPDYSKVQEAVGAIKAIRDDISVAVGFGIKNAQMAKEVGQMADAVVVGSALVQRIAENPQDPVPAATEFVASLAGGCAV